MPITVTEVHQHDVNELIERMRRVSLLEDKSLLPYQNASVSLEQISPDSLAPAQLYVLRSNLERQRHLKFELARHGVDLFRLNGFVELQLEGEDGLVGMVPPVVEESVEANGRVVNLICDGIHRLFLARLEWVVPEVVFVRGIDKRFPYYAYPNVRGWDDVQPVETLVEEGGGKMLKKWHRVEKHRALYRDFTGPFSNLSVPRGVGQM